MLRNLPGLAVFALAAVNTIASAQDVTSACRSRLLRGNPSTDILRSDPAAGILCMWGTPTFVQLVLRHATIAAALAELSTYQLSFRSTVQLDEPRDGTYRGSIAHVISRLLEGYNYVIKQENSQIEVVVFNRKGTQATAAPTIVPASQDRTEPRNSRNR